MYEVNKPAAKSEPASEPKEDKPAAEPEAVKLSVRLKDPKERNARVIHYYRLHKDRIVVAKRNQKQESKAHAAYNKFCKESKSSKYAKALRPTVINSTSGLTPKSKTTRAATWRKHVKSAP